jgi:uncharacterized protein (TIGR02271 family)
MQNETGQTRMDTQDLQVSGKDGLRGVIVERGVGASEHEVLVRFADNTEVLVGRDLLVARPDGSFYLPMSAADVQSYRTTVKAADAGRIVLPVVAEELTVGKRVVETGRVHLRTVVTERQETVDVPLERAEVDVERVEIGQFVETAPTARQEGDVLIIPLLEEVLVVEKRLRLTAEVHVRLRKTTSREPQQVTLRREEIAMDRVAADSSNEAGADR